MDFVCADAPVQMLNATATATNQHFVIMLSLPKPSKVRVMVPRARVMPSRSIAIWLEIVHKELAGLVGTGAQ